jgi:hypothetical protein
VQIAEYHVQNLGVALYLLELGSYPWPSIPIQAHFEGVVNCFVAAADKAAEAINAGWRLRLREVNLKNVIDDSRWNSRVRDELTDWFKEPIYNDIKVVRNRAIHGHYEKPLGPVAFQVVKPTSSNYTGSRELLLYAAAAVKQLDILEGMLSTLEGELRGLEHW